MKTLIFRLFLTFVAGCFILLFAIPWNYFNLHVPFSGPDYKLGLDLQGWVELDYKVDLSQVKQEANYDVNRKNSVVEWLKSIIDKRVESLNINDSVITSANYGGEEHIIVQIPLKGNDMMQNAQNIERAKKAIGKVVKIEFKEARDKVTNEDLKLREEFAFASYDALTQNVEKFSVLAQQYVNNRENVVYGSSEDISSLFTLTGSGSFEDYIWENGFSKEIKNVKNISGQEGYLIYHSQWAQEYEYVFIGKEPSIWKSAKSSDWKILNDVYFTKASVQYNDAFQPLVELTFNNEGAKIFGELTKRLVGQPMAIFVGGEMLTAPTINEPILTGKAVITGNYTPASANKLATDINTGVVPAPIYLTSERTIDAKLGKNSLEKIALAGLIGFIAIFLFLLVVYRFSGLIAALALFIYIVVTLAILKQFGIVLTLASIAGLVLSIGIAIDANILIFERVKDELKQGNKKQGAVQTGFEKSFSAIWDANITGLIVAIILFIFGVNMIKGFGFILGLGIIVSLFSVYFVSRLFMRILARTTKMSDTQFIGK